MNARKSLYDIKSFYNKKAVLKSSYQGMRYQVQKYQEELEPEEEGGEKKTQQWLLATVWPEPFCFEKTPEEQKQAQRFPYSEEGLDQVYDWLCGQYEGRRAEWEHKRDNPFEGLF